jgi:hypothetical protein
VPFTYALKVRIGQCFLKLRRGAENQVPAALPRRVPDAAGQEAGFRGQPAISLYGATHARVFDGERL